MSFCTRFACMTLPVLLACTGDADELGQRSDALETPATLGTLPSNLEVTASGAASIAIPIDVPEGRLGIGPKLSLVYDSRGGNGLLGVGWSLAGLSRVHRCASTLAQDGRTDGVNFNSLDRFCLDGRPLVVINGATYGAAGSEYRTVPDVQARVRLEATLGDGSPSRFTVYNKDGTTSYYRTRFEAARVSSTALDGTLTATASASVYAWDLTLVQDRNGNTMAFDWGTDQSPAIGVGRYPTSIRYTYAPYASGAAPRMVKFVYETRPDAVDIYESGFHQRIARRLRAIETYATQSGALSLLHSYRLGYRNDTQTKRSVLNRIEKCDPNNVCLPATELTTESGSLTFGTPIRLATVTGVPKIRVADVDGDGRDDVLWKPRDVAEWNVQFSRSTGFTSPRVITEFVEDGTGMAVIDADMDGRAEIVATPKGGGTLALMRWNGTSFEVLQRLTLGLDAGWGVPKFADIDGNGTPDLLASNGATGWQRNTGTYDAPYAEWQRSGLAPEMDTFVDGLAARLLGNGATQMLYDAGSAYRALISVGTNLDSVSTNVPVALNLDMFLDVNGDGLDDHFAMGTGRLRINLGGSFGPAYSAVSGTWLAPQQRVPSRYERYDKDKGIRAVDLNNDGRMDILQFWGGGWLGCLSNGFGFDCQTLPLSPLLVEDDVLSYPFASIDYNGDGVKDLVSVTNAGYLEVVPRTGRVPDRVVEIRNGLGAVDSIEYSTTTEPSLYTPGPSITECHYPQRCNVRRFPVVSRLHRANGLQASPIVNTEVFTYTDLRSDMRGAGVIGFQRTRRDDLRSGQITERIYNVDPSSDGRYFHLGLPEWTNIFQRVASDRARMTTTDWRNTTSFGAGSYFARPTQAVVRDYEWSGTIIIPARLELAVAARSPYRTIVREWFYDAYANLTRESDSRAGGTTNVRTLAYDVRPDVWLVGLLREDRVSSSKNGIVDEQVVAHEYDTLGRLTLTTVEPSRTELTKFTRYGYNALGLPVRLEEWGPTDAARVTTSGWDAEGMHPAWIQNAAGHRTAVEIHPGLGVMLSHTNAAGVITRFDYDTFGRLRRRTDADGRITSFDLTAGSATNIAFVRSELVNTGEATTTEFDRLGRPVRLARTIGGTQSNILQTWDALGRLASRSLPHVTGTTPQWVRITRDMMGRPLVVNRPDGSTTQFRYSPTRTERWDPPGHYDYRDEDPDGALVRSMTWVDGRPLVTTYRHGPFDRLLEVIDPAGNRTDLIEYDSRGRRRKLVNADAGEQLMTYNAFGELTSLRNGAGELTSFARDSIGRVTLRTASEGTTDYAWDVDVPGTLSYASSPDAVTTSFEYDALGRVVGKTVSGDDDVFTMRRTFDAFGRVSGVTYPSTPGGGLHVSYLYDADGQLARLESGTTIWWRAETRDAWAHVTRERLGNGTLVDRTYDPSNGRLSSIVSRRFVWSGGTTATGSWQRFQDLALTYHPYGLVASRTDAIENRTEQFTYDGANRLVQWTSNGTEHHEYDYDDLGNMTVSSGSNDSHLFEYLDPRPHVLSRLDGYPVTHDAAGRRTYWRGTDVAYTSFDLPRSIEGSAGETLFEYDAFQARTRKRGPTSDIAYVDGFYEQRRAPGQSPTHHFSIRIGDRLVAELVENDGVRSPRYIHSDHLGSANVITGSRGETVERRRYTPFGELASSAPGDLSAFTGGFTGHEQDLAEGLTNMRGRIYDPVSRRFLTQDPFVGAPSFGQSFNRYSYVLNSPLTLVDPSGFDWEYYDRDDPYDDYGSQHDYEGTEIHHTTGDSSPGPGITYIEYGESEAPDYGDQDGYEDQSYDDYSGYSDSQDYGDEESANWSPDPYPDVPRTNEWAASMSDPVLHAEGELPSMQYVHVFGFVTQTMLQYPTYNSVMGNGGGRGREFRVQTYLPSIAIQAEVSLVCIVGFSVSGGIHWSAADGWGASITPSARVGLDIGVSVGVSSTLERSGPEQGAGWDVSAGVGEGPGEVGASWSGGAPSVNASAGMGVETPMSATAGVGYTWVWE